MDNLHINDKAVKNAASVLRAIKHSLRQTIMNCIHNMPGRKTDVTSIYKRLKLEQSVCSQHLAILRRAGLVNTERQGKQIFYTVNYKRVEEVNNLADRF